MGTVVFPEDLVVLALFSVVFAEIWTRIWVWRARRRAGRALAALAAGEAAPDAVLLRKLVHGALDAFGGLFLKVDAEGRWHLTSYSREVLRRGLQAVGEHLKVRSHGVPPAGASLDLGGLDLDQLAGVAISQVPKKYQGIAAIVYRLVAPYLGGIVGKKTSGSTTTENPFLKEVQP